MAEGMTATKLAGDLGVLQDDDVRHVVSELVDLPDDTLAAGIPAGRIRDVSEVYEWEQTRSQGLMAEIEHPTLGPLTLPGPALRFFIPAPGGDVETTPGPGSHERARGHECRRRRPVTARMLDGAARRSTPARTGGPRPAA